MATSHGKLPGLRVTILVALIGLALGWLGTRYLTPIANAIVLSVMSGVLLLANFVAKALNDAFSEHLKVAKSLEGRRFAELVRYVSARRFDVNLGYVIANLGGALGALAAASEFVPATRGSIPPSVQAWLFLLAYAVSFTALPYLVRAARYWQLADHFTYDLETFVSEQTARKERLATMPRTSALSGSKC